MLFLLAPDHLGFTLSRRDFYPNTVELDDGVAEQHRPGGGYNFHSLLVLDKGACVGAVFGLYPPQFVEQFFSGRFGDVEVTPKVADVEALHQAEKEARLKTEQDTADAKKAEVSEWRKFRWGIITSFVTTLIDLIVHYTKLYSVK